MCEKRFQMTSSCQQLTSLQISFCYL